MKRRQAFECYQCSREYELTFEIEEGTYPKLLVKCPYCNAQGSWETARHRADIRDQSRGSNTVGSVSEPGYDFPKVVKLTRPEPSEEQ